MELDDKAASIGGFSTKNVEKHSHLQLTNRLRLVEANRMF
jgi:hypothetical protein